MVPDPPRRASGNCSEPTASRFSVDSSPAADPGAVPATGDLRSAIAEAVAGYRTTSNVLHLHLRLAALIEDATPDALVAAVEPYRDLPEVAGPVYERVVAAQPTNARALVILANAYWLGGRGPDIVGELAARARAADPSNRGAWHLWALSESRPRLRVERWRLVCEEFPKDDLARANLADNAAGLAGAENDPAALQLALQIYTELRGRATHPDQQAALDHALVTLRNWQM